MAGGIWGKYDYCGPFLLSFAELGGSRDAFGADRTWVNVTCAQWARATGQIISFHQYFVALQ